VVKKEKKQVTFQEIIHALLDDSKPFPARYIYRFSDLTPDEFNLLQASWNQVSVRRRQAVMEDIEEFNNDFVLNFFDVAFFTVLDSDAQVRLMAVRTLAEYEEDELAGLFISMAENDVDVQVRAAAATALGHYIYLGELEELPEELMHQVEACLLGICNGQDATKVRQRALESLGFSSREDVYKIVESAYASGDADWIKSALVAMGRSYNKEWQPNVMAALSDSRTSIRVEAITAAGELEVKEAGDILLEALEDEDSSVRQAAIWSLSQIGGEDVHEVLEKMLDDVEDEEEEDLIEAALENLEFTEEFARFEMMEFDEEESEEGDDIFDEEDFGDDTLPYNSSGNR
jgi:HEAT repeat protein